MAGEGRKITRVTTKKGGPGWLLREPKRRKFQWRKNSGLW